MIQFLDIPSPSYPLAVELEDNVLRSKSENGYVITRLKYTRQRKTWPVIRWSSMSREDWLSLLRFYQEDTAFGSLIFEWTDPSDDEAYFVRFAEPPKSELIVQNRYQVEIRLEEV